MTAPSPEETAALDALRVPAPMRAATLAHLRLLPSLGAAIQAGHARAQNKAGTMPREDQLTQASVSCLRAYGWKP